MKKLIHNWLIKMLLSKDGLEKEDINTEKRTINLGFYSMGTMFFTPKHNIACALLDKWYGYKFTEIIIKFHSTWCNMNPDKVNDDFLYFNERYNQEKNKVIEKHHLN